MLSPRLALIILLASGLAACSPAGDLYDQIQFPDDWRELGVASDAFNGRALTFAVETDISLDGLSDPEWLSAVIEKVELPRPYDQHDLQPTETGARFDRGIGEYSIFVAPREEPCSIGLSPGPDDSDVAWFVEREIGPGWEDVVERTLSVGITCE